MYPVLRLCKELFLHRNAPPLGTFDTHHSEHLCWPWDLDVFLELNNGRTLTLYDLGRIVLSRRTGLRQILARQGWGVVVAGASVRYRKRILAFQRFQMRSRCVGWDDKFFYMEQTMWRQGACTSHLLIRAAVTDAHGLVRQDRVAQVLDRPDSPPLPDWVTAWGQAETLRPWPPMQDAQDAQDRADRG
ncbi:acyl-CoA thioesterase [Pseudoruegeria sp. SK021]|uniref:acyl-CoA thioesterase n=1 Tax=Pseudoruegeria sp. SK021 TaxID=1933035 RepID=UPI000A2494C1|nr:acyl-CoA thioesterase [Pseudoruegeria sp. SK021]OSP55376.1 thioeseterase [Pseudoruegeria sp. SK021]